MSGEPRAMIRLDARGNPVRPSRGKSGRPRGAEH